MEIWKPALGLEALIEVSDAGRVRRLDGLIRKPQPHRKGYLVLKLWIGGKARTRTIHGLVAEAFIGARPPGAQVNHIDGVKTNNHASNLEWSTAAQNNAHAITTGLRPPSSFRGPLRPQRGSGNYNAKLTEPEAHAIRARLANGESGGFLSREFGVSKSAIYAIKYGRRWAI